MLKRVGKSALQRFIENYTQGVFEVFSLQNYHANRLGELMFQYADLPIDFADASLIILAEEMNDGRILSTDKRDFTIYRWKQTYCFDNLLL